MCVTVDAVSNGHHCNFQTKELYITSKLRKANVVNLEETSKFPTEGQECAGKHCNLFVKCMRQVTSICCGYRITLFYIARRPSQFCEMSVKATNRVTDPLR